MGITMGTQAAGLQLCLQWLLVCIHYLIQYCRAICAVNLLLQGHLSPAGKPSVSLQLVREMSMLDVGQPLRDIALVPLPTAAMVASAVRQSQEQRLQQPGQHPQQMQPSNSNASGTLSEGPAPHQCVLLRWGGLMSVLDMERGAEIPLASEIEVFWLSDSLACSPTGTSPAHLALSSTGKARQSDNCTCVAMRIQPVPPAP